MFSSVWTRYAMMAFDLLVSLSTSAAGSHVAYSQIQERWSRRSLYLAHKLYNYNRHHHTCVTVRTGSISNNGSVFKMFCQITFTLSVFIHQSRQSILSSTNQLQSECFPPIFADRMAVMFSLTAVNFHAGKTRRNNGQYLSSPLGAGSLLFCDVFLFSFMHF